MGVRQPGGTPGEHGPPEVEGGREKPQGMRMRPPCRSEWAGPSGPIGAHIAAESQRTIEAYRSQPNLVDEHANHEEDTARGGYAHRQLFELVQNSADALAGSGGGRIEVRLGPGHLYCADEGRAIDEAGVRALMFSHLSPKRGTEEIGRFGVGFKSVLGVTDAPEFFSRSGSFRFNRGRAASLIRPVAPHARRTPVLRTPEPVDPRPAMEEDQVLGSLKGWAANIVRLPLRPGAADDLRGQIAGFPAEFLLFVDHVRELVLDEGEGAGRSITLVRDGGGAVLSDRGRKTRWMVVGIPHRLSPDARSDGRGLDDSAEVPILWAAPLDRLSEPGSFWAFFPTMTASLLAGILNAPWKTNEDRQNLLPGVYNDELIDAAADMVAAALPALSSPEDPARHLDALPRRAEAGDTGHSARLREQLNARLRDREIAPDQTGTLRALTALRYPPREITDAGALDAWEALERRPPDWLHRSALTRNRLAALERLWLSRMAKGDRGMGAWTVPKALPSASVSEWLEALTELAHTPQQMVAASMAAIRTAALMPEGVGRGEDLGRIVLTAGGGWAAPDPDRLLLGAGGRGGRVHPELEADAATVDALSALGIGPASGETVFRQAAADILGTGGSGSRGDWIWFWRLARGVEPTAAADVIRSHEGWRASMRVRTVAGGWASLYRTLLPGPVVPADGSRDGAVTVDARFHDPHMKLLRELGAVDAPRAGHELSPTHLGELTRRCRDLFTRRDLPSSPWRHMLNFAPPAATSGPLDVLEALSDEGAAICTRRLLDLPSTYGPWTMRHDTQKIYPPMEFESPALAVLRDNGRVATTSGIRPLSDGLGDPPGDRAVLRSLLAHRMADEISEAFDLAADAGASAEPVGEDAPAALLDVWPGLARSLAARQGELKLIRCDEIRGLDGGGAGGGPPCVAGDEAVYVERQDDEERELRAVLRALGVRLADAEIRWVLLGLTPEDVRRARDEVRACRTDEERLCAAVGEAELRRGLPQDLLTILEDGRRPLPGAEVAQAAIATFHTGALRHYRHALARLDPPRQWAGRPRAVEFVTSLGFGEEWAGDPSARREPFVEVDGPSPLPALHGYQRRVVDRTRDLIRSGRNGDRRRGVIDGARGLLRPDRGRGERRGMISMPTGSGKTRVAVQAVVEAIREDGFGGGVLWVADRDELCEQAVEAWRQVWASEGTRSGRLRISRMWAGQPRPAPTAQMHVIVATIQTLFAKISRQPDAHAFLADFGLVVFDEAHRSVAPTFTSVMEELGLTRWRREDEPLLIGLTATPYRGHDERETRRLVGRYGRNRLDAGAFGSDDPQAVIEELQSMRVLARADHAVIEGGDFSLSADELTLSRETPWLPRSVEDRIAGDPARTLRIVRAYREHVDPDWPTLIFATSVRHSQTVAALLTRGGISARAVSSETETSVRRRVVEQFRAGEIRVLVNYGIFREGFDAPKTRAIVVARPVYSPNLYFQMIGRGLRGVRNGGNDRCLILNVQDNIENFERRLAFTELDWLWA